jgi:hypothetical protein
LRGRLGTAAGLTEVATQNRNNRLAGPIQSATFVAAILVTVLVFDADLHATSAPISVIVTAVVSTSVRSIPASIVTIDVLAIFALQTARAVVC